MMTIIVENELDERKKADLVCGVLNLLIKEQLSFKQIQEILQCAEVELLKLPIIGGCN